MKALVPVLLLALAAIANAQSDGNYDAVYGYSSVDYDISTKTIIAYTETDLDNSLEVYYQAVVTGVFKNVTSNTTLATNTVVDTVDNGYVSLEFDLTAPTPGSTYQMTGDHKGTMIVDQNRCDVTCGMQWVDYDYFNFYTSLGIVSSDLYSFIE